MSRRVVPASAESLLATLRALGVPVEGHADCSEALRVARRARDARPWPPVVVAWNGRLRNLPVRLPARLRNRPARLDVELESGEVRRHDIILSKRVADEPAWEGARHIQCRLSLPGRLPTGYHRLVLQVETARFHTLALSAPLRTYTDPGARRSMGFFAPLYALRSATNWGAGDFTDLARFAHWVGHQGGDVVGTLPLLPLFLERPLEPSPYSPVSRLFWNEFYLDPDRIPELEGCRAAQTRLASPAVRRRIAALRSGDQVGYRAIAALKRSVIEILAGHFFRNPTPRHRVLRDFLQSHPEVETYATFRAAQETRDGSWSDWPESQPGQALRPRDVDPARRQYHLYAQWQAHEQVGDVVHAARRQGVRLYLDLPLGVHPDGYDAWRFRRLFARGAAGGAPPDPVFTRGQSWGFAPLHPQALREDGYGYLRSCLRHHLGSAGMLRFDHVMSLHRLYWIPSGLSADRGVYVRYPADELYAVLSIESHRHQAVIVGENLGTVPPAVNRALARHGVRGMYVTQYELGSDPRAPLPPPPRSCVASLNTHDMPPFAAYWAGRDIRDRFELGLMDKQGLISEQNQREKARKTLARRLSSAAADRKGRVDRILLRLWAQLSAGPAEVVLGNLEDVWLETRPQNVPGTTLERVNWRHKIRFAMECWHRLPRMRRALAALKRPAAGTLK